MVNNGRARKRVLAPTIVLPRLSTRHRQFTPLAFQVLRIQHQALDLTLVVTSTVLSPSHVCSQTAHHPQLRGQMDSCT
nr:MAG TPA: hypothetical protein [Caudoviricetes sp.]DAQ37599.1 MAG TPA: hypothetical protein [Caudoviricetes sp.]